MNSQKTARKTTKKSKIRLLAAVSTPIKTRNVPKTNKTFSKKRMSLHRTSKNAYWSKPRPTLKTPERRYNEAFSPIFHPKKK